ncbi:MAG: hypothetical protein JWO78_1656 [Micavibrio sp.]|nr:hypothetical protein [Micavibrio sp.]
MGQEIKDVPKTGQEYRRQKGPVPLWAILMALCLIAAFVFFFLPALTGAELKS